jgi:hypothetical protein
LTPRPPTSPATEASPSTSPPFGDNTDGSSWAKAFRTIQAALSAIPDDKGGHRVIVRPGTYPEALLMPKHKGAAGSYNLLVGDVDGKLGSGATGWVVIDSGVPGVAVKQRAGGGNPEFDVIPPRGPESGFKCVDWWCTFRSDPSHPGVNCDRWIFRGLYATGSEAGFVWDMTTAERSEFSAVVEDCVGIGRFAGAGVIAAVSRKGEPVIFRRSYFMNLDTWGDAGAAYVRAHNPGMPAAEHPDALFEDCTLVSPDNALQVSYPGSRDRYSRISFKRCKLIVLNFSQPHGNPSSGVVCCDALGKYLHVDFEDCLLAGYTLFGTSRPQYNNHAAGEGKDPPPTFTLNGTNRAYVQFEQELPKGFERLGLWPTEAMSAIAPPKAPPPVK